MFANILCSQPFSTTRGPFSGDVFVWNQTETRKSPEKKSLKMLGLSRNFLFQRLFSTVLILVLKFKALFQTFFGGYISADASNH